MNELLKTLNEYLQAAAKLAIEQAPNVWENTLFLVRLSCIYELIVFVVVALTLLSLNLWSRKILDTKNWWSVLRGSKLLQQKKRMGYR